MLFRKNGGHVLQGSTSEISTMKTSLYSQDDYACYAAPQFTSRNGVLQVAKIIFANNFELLPFQ